MEELQKPKREKYFYSYTSAVAATGVCRRTLCRWIDILNVEPLQFEDNDRVFLTKPQIALLLEYKEYLHSHEPELLKLFREGIQSGDDSRTERARRGFKVAKEEREQRRKKRPVRSV